MTSHNKTVIIHGQEWEAEHIAESVKYCRSKKWQKASWKRRPALIAKKGGASSLYIGQTFDPEKFNLVEDGWEHDHCEICWWTLCDSDNPEENTGYTDGKDWVCSECYEKLLQ